MTGFTSNIDDLITHFKSVAQQASAIDVSQALLVGVNAAASQMRERIFNEGKDVDGVPFGKYSGKKIKSIKQSRKLTQKEESVKKRLLGSQSDFSEYELIRLRQGRQVRYKDLELKGDLRRGIVPVNESDTTAVINKKKVAVAIPNNDLFAIAGFQEEQVGRIRGGGRAVIFKGSQSEKQFMIDNINEALKQLYVRVLNS